MSSRYKSVSDAIHDIAHESELNLDQQADLLNINRPTYYRYINKYDDTKFPQSLMVPFMRLHKNDEPLRRAANEMGCMIVKIPQGTLKESNILSFLATYHKEFSELIINLSDFFDHEPTEEKRHAMIIRMNRHIEQSAGVKLRVHEEKGQYDFFNE